MSRSLSRSSRPSGADGPESEFPAVESPEGIFKALRGIIHRLVNEGAIPADRVVILTQRRDMKDRLIGTTAAGLTLGAIETAGTIAVETIHRFKGLEADATIVILDRLDKDRDRALAYIGLSRARFRLVVIGSPAVGAALGLS